MAACVVMSPVLSVYRLGVATPAVAIESIMVCRVFRKMILSTSGRHSGHREPEAIIMTTVLPYSTQTNIEVTINGVSDQNAIPTPTETHSRIT